MYINIRPVRMDDAGKINEIRIMDGVRENILGIISERMMDTQAFIEGLTQDDHILVAEIEEEGAIRIAGFAGLHVNKWPRMRHSAGFGIAVHKNYQGKGVGKALMEKIIDLADNWLMIKRLELSVFTDNEQAIGLYKKFGFEIEGTKKYAVIKNGKYADEYVMARFKL